MHPSNQVYLVALLMLFALNAFAFAQVETTAKYSLKPKTFAGMYIPCDTPNNETGVCVHKSMCNDDYVIESGGRLTDSELRVGSDCNVKLGEWCCSWKNVTTKSIVPTPKKEIKCTASSEKNCPWCVKLYRTGQDDPYCLGALIGSKTILTTATCVLQAQKQDILARVPTSANPDTKHSIVIKLKHPKYNSGTRWNDIALLGTASSVQWGAGGEQGACIDPGHTLQGTCIAADVDETENIDTTAINISQGSCISGGNVPDVMCGKGTTPNTMAGSPIMCLKNDRYILTGITKTTLPPDFTMALLGNLDYTWLINTLKSEMGFRDEDILYNLNY